MTVTNLNLCMKLIGQQKEKHILAYKGKGVRVRLVACVFVSEKQRT